MQSPLAMLPRSESATTASCGPWRRRWRAARLASQRWVAGESVARKCPRQQATGSAHTVVDSPTSQVQGFLMNLMKKLETTKEALGIDASSAEADKVS